MSNNTSDFENPWGGSFVSCSVWSTTEQLMMGNAPRDYLEAYGCLPEDIDTALLNQLREERDRRMALTDWMVSPDRTPSEAQLAYRQALRDITKHYTSLDDVIWPELEGN